MSPFIHLKRSTSTSAALIPLLPAFRNCRSIVEAAEVGVRILTEEFDAAAAMVEDRKGSLAEQPTGLSQSTVTGLRWAPVGESTGAADSTLAGLTVAAFPIRGPDEIRLIAAWDRESRLQTEDVRTMAAVLTELIPRVGRTEASESSDPLPSTRIRSPSAEYLTRLIETIPAVIYVAEMGSEGTWRYVSPQIETILGYTPNEWVADPKLWYRSIHPEDRQHAMSFEDERLLGIDFNPPAEYRLKTRAGHYIWVYEWARLVSEGNGTLVWHGVMQDISAMKMAELALIEKTDQQALVARLGEMAIRGEDPDKLLRTAADWIGRMDRILDVSIWKQENNRQIHLLHRSRDIGKTLTVPVSVDDFPGSLLVDGQPIVVPDWNRPDPRLERYRTFLPDGVASSALTPILGSDQQFGVIIAHADEPGIFTEEDQNFLLAIANVLGNAIERSRVDRSMRYRLNHDALTDLPNRKLFTERLAQALAAAEQNQSRVGVLFIDLDHFKLINDAIGHHAGDQVLCEIAPRLSHSVERGDTVARFGGDEFAIVLAGLDTGETAWATAEKILTEISHPIAIEGRRPVITASVGVTIWKPGDHGRGPEDLIQEADAAMYEAKEAGRARIQAFGGAIQRKLRRRLEIESELHQAVDQHELTVRYQPLIELKNCELTGFEALVRWNHPVKGMLTPAAFIPIAEKSELIRKVDSWVLRQAVAQAAEWNRGCSPDRGISISVNCSSRQIRSDGFTDLVARLLEKHDLEPGLLTVEITETVLMTGGPLMDRVMEDMVRIGVRLSLDDFGTGFSSLSSLGEFPLDEIKIDRQFIEHVNKGDRQGSAIIDAVVRIAEALSLTVVAEAVSDEDAFELVRDLGCHAAQGYLIAKPLNVPEATDLVARSGPIYPC